MKEFKLTFKKVYCIYLLILAALCIAAIAYVNGLLHQYEDMRPEQCVEAAIEELVEDASNESFFTKYELPEVSAERFEENIDVKKAYLEQFVAEDMSFVSVNNRDEEDVLYYEIQNAGRTLAKVKLKAVGSEVTKLLVFSFREWQIEEITPVLEKKDYTILVPQDFTVCANNIALTVEDGVSSDGKSITYTVSGVYVEPVFEIKNKDGVEVKYTVDNDKILAEFYDYSLILPSALTVHVNDELITGEAQDNNRISYNIQTLEKPEVVVSDYYGNSVSYDGKNEIPLTYLTVFADDRYSVKIDDGEIAKEAITLSTKNEYAPLKDYVENLPQVNMYTVAVLKNDAEVSVFDEAGNPVSLEDGKDVYDFTNTTSDSSDIPNEVSAKLDILKVAQDWSLFMSNDKRFAELEAYLIAGSYQYNIAHEYATGVDITFTSNHTLANPAFTENSITNFRWITEDSFSVDVHFVKHMVLKSGKRVDDTMNNRFYFVNYDDTEDGIDNPTWKIASMREIIENGN